EDALRLDPEQRRARENLETAKARIPAPASAPAAGVARIAPAPGVRLIEVAPHVYELKLPPRPIAARPLPPLPQAEPPAPLPERRFRLEVSNGNGVPGLAARVSARLRAAGVAGARLTNQPPYRQAATEIQYREGYALEAERLAALLRQEVRLVASPRLRAATDVRLVLGHDAPTETALIAGPQHVALAH
ncbi:MAG TPA: LytR C-terminal domain-containing protein, partial [Burkholderiales bacterium]|nr:LytR C-terminal domain-containing protein [Burkholderiales bacterium]